MRGTLLEDNDFIQDSVILGIEHRSWVAALASGVVFSPLLIVSSFTIANEMIQRTQSLQVSSQEVCSRLEVALLSLLDKL